MKYILLLAILLTGKSSKSQSFAIGLTDVEIIDKYPELDSIVAPIQSNFNQVFIFTKKETAMYLFREGNQYCFEAWLTPKTITDFFEYEKLYNNSAAKLNDSVWIRNFIHPHYKDERVMRIEKTYVKHKPTFIFTDMNEKVQFIKEHH